MRALAFIVLCCTTTHALFAQGWSDWMPCDDNVCIGPLLYKYRFIDRKAQNPSANISASEAYELEVRFRNTFTKQIHFDFKCRNGMKCPSGRKSLKPGEEGQNWTLVANQVAPRISISHVVFGDNGFSGEYCECNPVNREYENKQSRLSGAMLQPNSARSSSSYNTGYNSNSAGSNAYSQPNGFDNAYYEQVRREAQNQQRAAQERDQNEARRQVQEYQQRSEQARQQMVESTVNTLGMIAQGVANNRRLREEAKANQLTREAEERREAERERQEEQRAAEEAARIEKLKISFPEFLSRQATPIKNYDDIYTPRYFYFVSDKGVLKVSFSNLFRVSPTAYHSLPFVVDIKSNYHSKFGASNNWLMGPFTNEEAAVQHKKNLIEKTYQHYWEIESEHIFYFDQPQSGAGQSAEPQAFWGVSKAQKNSAEPQTSNTRFWGTPKTEKEQPSLQTNTSDQEKTEVATFWGAQKTELASPPTAKPTVKPAPENTSLTQPLAAPPKTAVAAVPATPPQSAAAPQPVKSPQPNTYRLTKPTSLRESPSSTSTVLLRFTAGDQIEVLEKTNQWWWKVRFADQTGYAKAQLLEKTKI